MLRKGHLGEGLLFDIEQDCIFDILVCWGSEGRCLHFVFKFNTNVTLNKIGPLKSMKIEYDINSSVRKAPVYSSSQFGQANLTTCVVVI